MNLVTKSGDKLKRELQKLQDQIKAIEKELSMRGENTNRWAWGYQKHRTYYCSGKRDCPGDFDAAARQLQMI